MEEMKINMGSADRIIRVLAALLIVVLYATSVISGMLATVFLIVAAVFTLTSLIGSCPLYLPFGINTRKSKDKTPS
jgi:cellobiose-specific phosphotransferase system component IIC